MPKVVSSHRRARSAIVQQRCDQRNHHHPQVTTTACGAAAWTTSPRKVSFEEGHQSNPSFPSSSRASSSSNASIASSGCQPGGLLRRKAPSVCLVDLARGEDCCSPVPLTSAASDESSCCGGSLNNNSGSACPSSPWGHFVDILIPLEEEEDDCTSSLYNNRNRHLPSIPTSFSARDCDAPTFQPRRRHRLHQQQRCMTPPVVDHPYGLAPRRTRKGSFTSFKASSFLPGLVVLDEAPLRPLQVRPHEETKEVEVALQRLKF